MSVERAVAKRERTFFGHPWGLAALFSVETWERFSFYGMQAILAYYLYYSVADGGLGLERSSATSIVGAYGGLVYLSTVVGAWLADRVLGAERTLFGGALVIMAGHLCLAFVPGLGGVGAGLVLVAFGSGALKTSSTAMVGELYTADDRRRDAGFSLYYMGVNLGGFFGPLITGAAQHHAGFHVGFGLAAVGMAIGLIVYTVMRRSLGGLGGAVPNPLPAGGLRRALAGAVVVAVVVVVAAVSGLLRASNLAAVVAGVTAVVAAGYFAYILGSSKISAGERRRVFAFLPMFAASTVFWSLYQQQFTTVAVYADSRVNRTIFGWEIPPSWVQSINPVFIIVFAGVFAAVWTALGPAQPSAPAKFALGTAIMGVAFLCFLPMAGGGPNSAPLLGLIGILMLFSFAELMLSPVGLSLATRLAPRAFHSQLVALFFLSVALGTALSGVLAGWYDPQREVPYFLILGLASLLVSAAIAAASGWIKVQMRGD
ncbi:putative peptide transporter [Gordonia araii NBRC 100433]|uniref:Putative peptide transporter n=1 Tax=Gordonia araii NBRC 100433 TaxID=1073574 RepID=G7H5W5_9ACTN|nr:oligopeptide:H+ symporter [Gordonia araii]NNG95684.1 MFS transporter [Gordonia araii NBRC 100433]GAB11240.1 putative peptide transporter [Gordonia araii NBRC 100433]